MLLICQNKKNKKIHTTSNYLFSCELCSVCLFVRSTFEIYFSQNNLFFFRSSFLVTSCPDNCQVWTKFYVNWIQFKLLLIADTTPDFLSVWQYVYLYEWKMYKDVGARLMLFVLPYFSVPRILLKMFLLAYSKKIRDEWKSLLGATIVLFILAFAIPRQKRGVLWGYTAEKGGGNLDIWRNITDVIERAGWVWSWMHTNK